MYPKTNLKVFQYQISTSAKRTKQQLPSKTNFSTCLQLETVRKALELPKLSSKLLNLLSAKACLQRQTFKKYLRETLVFM